MPIDPVTAAALIGAGSKVVSSIGNSIVNRGKEKRAAAEAAKDRQAQKDRDLLGVASDENMADPFRHSTSQMNAAYAFDQMANTRPKTVHIPGLDPKWMPTLGGGYQPSQELRDAAGAARTAVLGGQGQAPTMTNSANYGQTGVLNLLELLARQGLIDPKDPRITGLVQEAGAAGLPGARNTGVAGRLPLDQYSYGAEVY